MHLTHGHYARSWGYRILAMCQMRKSEEPLVVHRSLTWWLIDVCGSSAILLAVHLARTTTEPLQRVSDKYCPTGSNQQEVLATPGSVQLRQTLALWTLASRLPEERPLLETNGDILWTQQRSSGVRYERRKVRCVGMPRLAALWSGTHTHTDEQIIALLHSRQNCFLTDIEKQVIARTYTLV